MPFGARGERAPKGRGYETTDPWRYRGGGDRPGDFTTSYRDAVSDRESDGSACRPTTRGFRMRRTHSAAGHGCTWNRTQALHNAIAICRVIVRSPSSRASRLPRPPIVPSTIGTAFTYRPVGCQRPVRAFCPSCRASLIVLAFLRKAGKTPSHGCAARLSAVEQRRCAGVDWYTSWMKFASFHPLPSWDTASRLLHWPKGCRAVRM